MTASNSAWGTLRDSAIQPLYTRLFVQFGNHLLVNVERIISIHINEMGGSGIKFGNGESVYLDKEADPDTAEAPAQGKVRGTLIVAAEKEFEMLNSSHGRVN